MTLPCAVSDDRSVKRKPFLFALGFIWLLAACVPAALGGTPPRAVNGVLDLSAWDFERDGPVKLDGEWEWYWGKLLTPQDFAASDAVPPTPTGLYRLPSAWNGRTVQGQTLASDGYATFRLTIKLPRGSKAGRTHAVKLLFGKTAYRLWGDTEEVSANGVVGPSADASVLKNLARVGVWNAEDGTVHLTLHLATWNYYRGGPRDSIWFGPLTQILAFREERVAHEIFILGCIFSIGISQLVLYLLRRRDIAPLYLSLVCFSLGVWSITQGETLLWRFLPDLRWETTLKVEFLAVYLSTPLMALFMAAAFAQEFSRMVLRLCEVIYFSLAGLVLVTPSHMYSSLLPLAQMGILLTFAYMLVVAALAIRNRRREAVEAAVGYMLGVVALIRDLVLLMQGQVPDVFWIPYGFLGVLFAQAFIVARQLARAYATIEGQADHLARTNRAYFRFVPQEFLPLLGKDDITSVQLGDHTEKTLVILFADIRDFTTLSERMSPEENFVFINALLADLAPIIRAHHGFIDEYLGDGILAIFPDHPEDALKAAIAMQGGVTQFNTQREREGQSSIHLGIGAHIGSLMLGIVGEPERMDGSVVGDVVNTASRLEGLTKHYAVTLIVSEQVLMSIGDVGSYSLRALGKVRPKGKDVPVTVYEVFDGDHDGSAACKRDTRAEFEEGLRLFQAGQFAGAQTRFAHVVAANPHDRPALHYQARAAHFVAHGPPADWDGIEMVSGK